MSGLVADPAWRAEVRSEGLLVHAGADESYLVPGLPGDDAERIAALFGLSTQRLLDPVGLPTEAAVLVRQLTSLGALRPADLPQPDAPRELDVRVHALGDLAAPLGTALINRFPGGEGADLTLLVRTGATLRALTEAATELASGGPYLLLDLAYHHTISLGPLVVPGHSACVGCLAARAAARWGDPEPPRRPRSSTHVELAVALAGHANARIGAGSLDLLERVVSFDTDALTSTAEHVLPSADCEVCPGLDTGQLRLPWEES